MRLGTVIHAELVKMFRQKGTYAGYALLLALIALFIWGTWQERSSGVALDSQFGDDMVYGGDTLSGPLVAYLLLRIPIATTVFIPLLVSMISGGLIAGEAQRGTLRTMLVRPVQRWVIITGKMIAAFIHVGSLVAFLGAMSLGGGYLVFGGGDIITVGHGLQIFDEREGLRLLGYAYLGTALSMCAVAALAVFCSTIFEHPLTASGVTVGFLIVSGALMVIPSLDWMKPYLLTDHLDVHNHIIKYPIAWSGVAHELRWVGAYTLAAFAGTLGVFCRKDITC